MTDEERITAIARWLFEDAIRPEEWEDDMDLLLEMAQETIGEDDLTESELRKAIAAEADMREEALQKDADEESPEEWKQ